MKPCLRPLRRTVWLALVATSLSIGVASGTAASDPPADTVELVVSGRLQSVVVEGSEQRASRTVSTLLLRDGTRLRIRRTPDLPVAGTVTATVRVDAGTATADRLSTRSRAGLEVARSLVGEPVLLEEVRATEPAVAAAGLPHRAHVAVVRNQGDWGATTDQQLRDRVDTAVGYWETEGGPDLPSFEVASFESFDSEGCGLDSTQAFFAVTAEAKAEVYPQVDFDAPGEHLVVLVPDECLTGPLGLGLLGSSVASGGTLVGIAEGVGGTRTLAHELGHNLSLNHANVRACNFYDPTSCSTWEYGDVYSVMGYGSGHDSSYPLTALGSSQRSALGLLAPAESERLTLPDTESSVTTTVALAPRGAGAGLRSLELVEPETGRSYFVDWRSGTGRDSGAWYLSGYRDYRGLGYGPGVVVTTPEDDRASTLLPRAVGGADHQAAWQAGESFTNDRGTVTVRVDAVDAAGATVTATIATDAVPFTGLPTPVVTGEPEVGRSLWLDAAGWPDDAFLDVRWLVDGVAAESDDPWTFYLYRDYRGATVEVEVLVTREGSRAKRLRSAPVGPVRRSISGFVDIWAYPLQVGRPVSSTVRTTPGDAALAYQWLVGGTPVVGATGPTYTPVPADGGRELTLRVNATAPDHDDTVLESEPLQVPQAPVQPGSPTISGDAALGSTLLASPGSWPAGTTLTYQWLRNGSPIAGATGTTYEPVVADVGRDVAVRVRGTKPGLVGAQATSAAVRIAPGTLQAATPRVAGKARVGRRLTARPGTWTAGTGFSYQWLADDRAIRRANGSTLRLGKKMRGKRISVRVTGTQPGYAKVRRTSAQTRAVRR